MRRDGANGSLPQARREGLVVEQIGDELLIYDLERDRAHALNASAALVFRHCDGRRSVEKLVAHMSEEAGRPVEEAVVLRALQRLEDAHLLLEAPAPVAPPQWSRRQALGTIGKVAAGVGLGVPVVRSIVVPTAAEAQVSCTPPNGMCGTVSVPTGCIPTGPPCCAGFFCQGAAVDGQPCFCQ